MFENLKNFGVAQFTIDKRRICGDDLTACLNLRLKKVGIISFDDIVDQE